MTDLRYMAKNVFICVSVSGPKDLVARVLNKSNRLGYKVRGIIK